MQPIDRQQMDRQQMASKRLNSAGEPRNSPPPPRIPIPPRKITSLIPKYYKPTHQEIVGLIPGSWIEGKIQEDFMRVIPQGANISGVFWRDGAGSKLLLVNPSPTGEIGETENVAEIYIILSKGNPQVLPNTIMITTNNSSESKMKTKQKILEFIRSQSRSRTPNDDRDSYVLQETGDPLVFGKMVGIKFSVKEIPGVMDKVAFIAAMGQIPKAGEGASAKYKAINTALDSFHKKLDQMDDPIPYTSSDQDIIRLAEGLKFAIGDYIGSSRTTDKTAKAGKKEAAEILQTQVDDAIKNGFKDELDNLRRKRWKKLNPKPLSDDNKIPGTKGKVGSGAQGEVFKYTFHQDGKDDFEAVVKLENPGLRLNENAIFTGIPENNPQQSLRAVIAYKISEEFKLGIIPRTEFFVGTDDNGHPKLGQALEFVKGSVGQRRVVPIRTELDPDTQAEIRRLDNEYKAAKQAGNKAGEDEASKALAKFTYYEGPDGKYYNAVFPSPKTLASLNALDLRKKQKQALTRDEQKELDLYENVDGEWFAAALRPIAINYDQEIVQKGLSDLQIFDYIIGHADRNAGNWIYVKDGNTIIGVKGIDNDDSFGYKWEPEGTTGHILEPKTPHVPPVVDVETAIKILKMDLIDPKILEGLSPKDPDEISATRVRLKHVQDQIIDRARKGGIAAFPRQANGDALLEELRVRVNGVNGDVLPPLKTWGAGVRGEHKDSNSYLGKMIARAGDNNINAAPDNDQLLVRV